MNVETTMVYSFTKHRHQGNPAGVVENPDFLTETQMKHISKTLHVSETAFLFPSTIADYLIRFFSPTVEVDLCGHATIAAFTIIGNQYAQKQKKILSFTQETKTGLLSVYCYYDTQYNLDHVMMEQQTPQFTPLQFDYSTMADALNINDDNLQQHLPKYRVSTGLFTLPLCVDSYDTLKNLQPDFNKITQICYDLDVGSFHVFTFDTLDDSSLYHARNFAPVYGVNEDPVTGTANGAVCAYLKQYNNIGQTKIICEQGDCIRRPGRVYVDLSKEIVLVGGHAYIDTTQKLTV